MVLSRDQGWNELEWYGICFKGWNISGKSDRDKSYGKSKRQARIDRDTKTMTNWKDWNTRHTCDLYSQRPAPHVGAMTIGNTYTHSAAPLITMTVYVCFVGRQPWAGLIGIQMRLKHWINTIVLCHAENEPINHAFLSLTSCPIHHHYHHLLTITK